jgi:lysine biosynthesis protein LysW
MIKTLNSNLQTKINKTACPICSSEVDVPFDVEKGQILSCPGCGIELEVKEIKNGDDCLELQEFIIEGEDWGE